MTVSFLIPTWNRRDLLESALASVLVQSRPPHQILVVDNGSQDGSEEAARAAGARVLQLGSNRGFSFAVNRGLEAACGDAVAVINNDVQLAPDWTEKLSAALRNDDCWFAIGKLLDATNPGRIDGVGDAVSRGGAGCRLGHARPDGPWFNRSRRTYFPSATAVLARREFFTRVGAFEEAFFAYLEDVDLGLRAALLGLGGVYVPEALAYHRGSSTVGPWSPDHVEWMSRNQLLLLAKFYPLGLLARFWRPVAAAQLLWAAMAIRRKRGRAYARGLCQGLIAAAALRRASSRWRADGQRLAEVLVSSEREVACFEQATGWDPYWRWYFRLAPAPPETQP